MSYPRDPYEQPAWPPNAGPSPYGEAAPPSGYQPVYPAQTPPPYQPAGYPATGGFPPADPPPNKMPWIVGGALVTIVAVVATVLILTSGSDKNTAAGGHTSATTTTSTTSATPTEPSVQPSTYLAGDWSVTTVVTKIASGSLLNENGDPVKIGESGFGAPQPWTFTGSCSTAEACAMTGDLKGSTDAADFILQKDVWVGSVDFVFNCDKQSDGTAHAEIEIQYADADTLTGTMVTTTEPSCGGINVTEELTLVRA